ncbi:TPA: hypothetical protein QDC29_000983 [Burkholderia aenigmatica]|nr:hypothetical protein [Burkholderia aenigmatica]HDR9614962.1 hypothetical protein [Burkholderia aenigmatica]HDR9669782.1 hypothetical protein [Burkholderia aenigmatica]
MDIFHVPMNHVHGSRCHEASRHVRSRRVFDTCTQAIDTHVRRASTRKDVFGNAVLAEPYWHHIELECLFDVYDPIRARGTNETTNGLP